MVKGLGVNISPFCYNEKERKGYEIFTIPYVYGLSQYERAI